jgi:adenylosuccinate synthase
MPVTVLVGCQWGDEGKGKVADLLARRMDWVARYGGGHNAGHTVYLGREKFVLHLVPCGILQERPRCVIGHGTVVDPIYLLQEMDGLTRRDVPLKGRLYLSECAHVVMPWHPWLESLEGQDTRLGTTRRGIGPAYQDKAGRTGLRVHELLDPAILRQKIEEQADRLEQLYRAVGQAPPQPISDAVRQWGNTYVAAADRLRPFVADTVDMLLAALQRDERILCEGAQGTFLDLDLGTYPFVTSSTTVSAGAATGLGIPPAALRKVVGICKAYTTRVGEGPFPTELSGEEAEVLRRQGAEYGATTGRPRRVGWLDLAQLRQAVRINGVTGLYLTKLDVLSGMPRIKGCVAYEGPAGRLDRPPPDGPRLAACRPVYEEFDGWKESLRSVRRWPDLPATVRAYVTRVEEIIGCPIQGLSVGSPRTALVPVPSSRRRAKLPRFQAGVASRSRPG